MGYIGDEEWDKISYDTQCVAETIDGNRCGRFVRVNSPFRTSIPLCSQHFSSALEDLFGEVRGQIHHHYKEELTLLNRQLMSLQVLLADAELYGSVVYFLQRKDLAIKIGTSTQYKTRKTSLETKHGKTLLIATVPGGYQLEKMIQDLHREDWIEGEWYRPSLSLLNFISQVTPFVDKPIEIYQLTRNLLIEKAENYLEVKNK